MAKGSVRKKGSKWYYRFCVEDESSGEVSTITYAQYLALKVAGGG